MVFSVLLRKPGAFCSVGPEGKSLVSLSTDGLEVVRTDRTEGVLEEQ